MKIMRLADVCKLTGLARSSIYKQVALGTFPKPVNLGGRAVGWVEEEVEGWILERIEERDERLAPDRQEMVGRASDQGKSCSIGAAIG